MKNNKIRRALAASNRVKARIMCWFFLLMAGAGMWNAPVYADEIPSRVAVQAFVQAEDGRLNLLMRVPMDALLEAQFPLRGEIGYVIFSQARGAMEDAAYNQLLQAVQVFEGDRLLGSPRLDAVRIALPSNRGFVDFASARTTVNSPALDDSVDLYFRQGFLDVLASYEIESEDARFSIDARLGGLGLETTTVLRYVLSDGSERTFSYIGNPGRVYLDPRWYQAVFNFVTLGFDHILEGTDHLLFLLCLLIPLRRIRALIPVVTSFTIAHSVTLIASALGWVPSAIWFPSLIETLIALSIVYMALENIVGVKQEHRWKMTFGFGLVHGFGFSFLLTESMQFAGSHLVSSLLAFNVGVELGQILVLLIAVPVIHLVFKYMLPERTGVILLSAIVAHWAWHWMEDRFAGLMAYQINMPAIDRYFFAGLLQWFALLALSAALLWLLQGLFTRFVTQDRVV
ncbi:HupE/UreJ family protein [Pseudohongiella spirulinae]|uniref:HupE/UreJ family protein n=1 Tax=Pseudohongiella spirulinae TaxID=1249552 RepID=A0A0S2KGE4_9GAMM|nr:HupE/UreJ family protein [Pseudohongiella spirulinae]ALO47108.1 hypothetical protein PS2015_2474 [Pseudohongiella spirulinae]